MKICLFLNEDNYQAANYRTRQLASALQHHGIETSVVPVNGGRLSSEAIEAVHAFTPNLLCSFHHPLPPGERYYWESLPFPHLSIVLSPAFYSTALTALPSSIISCGDQQDYAMLSSSFQRVFFWPHAIKASEDTNAPKGHRPYDVVFFGSCYDYESLRLAWQQRFPQKVGHVIDNAAERFFADETLSLAEALTQAWEASNLSPQGIDFIVLYTFLDHYARGKERVETIRAIKSARVHVFGNIATETLVAIQGWSHYLSSQPNVTFSPGIPLEQTFEILKQSKMLLSSTPFYRHGSSEMVLAALACGALPLSSRSDYLQKEFGEGKELLFYHTNDLGNLDNMVNSYIQDAKQREMIVSSGCLHVLKSHTWDCRVKELLAMLPSILRGDPR